MCLYEVYITKPQKCLLFNMHQHQTISWTGDGCDYVQSWSHIGQTLSSMHAARSIFCTQQKLLQSHDLQSGVTIIRFLCCALQQCGALSPQLLYKMSDNGSLTYMQSYGGRQLFCTITIKSLFSFNTFQKHIRIQYDDFMSPAPNNLFSLL